MSNKSYLEISSPTGGGREGAVFYLNRFLQNRNYTFGKLTIGNYTFDTMELAIPKPGNSYQKKCLPPGEYKVKITYGAVLVNGNYTHQPWLIFDRIKGYPHAAFMSSFTSTYPPVAAIYLGNYDPENEWSIEKDDKVTINMICALTSIYADKDNLTLVITNDPNIIVHDYTLAEYQQLQREEQERKQREQQEAELQKLIDEQTLPNPPVKGREI